MSISKNSNLFQSFLLPQSIAIRWAFTQSTAAVAKAFFVYPSKPNTVVRSTTSSRCYSSTSVITNKNDDDRSGSSSEGKKEKKNDLSTLSSSSSSSDPTTTTMKNTLCSKRGRIAVGLLPSYLNDAKTVSKYSPITNPNGALQLGVAENKMMEDWLVPMLNTNTENNTTTTIPEDAIYYQPTSGRDDFKASMASYIEEICSLPKGRIIPNNLIVGSGCNAVLENLCMTLADMNDTILIPTPYYAAFEFDVGARAGLHVVPVTTEAYNNNHHHHPHDDLNDSSYLDSNGCINPKMYYPNIASLDAAYERSIQLYNCIPRILLISHPMNPLGICYPNETIVECIEWCRNKHVHFICDEIYAGSVYRNSNNNNEEEEENDYLDTTTSSVFTSALQLANNADGGGGLGPYVHWVYALSKDYALSGLRIGAAYTENTEIMIPMQKLNDLCQISSTTQLWAMNMLSKRLVEATTTTTDTGDSSSSEQLWTTAFRRVNHYRLRQRYNAIVRILQQYHIPFLPAQAGLFIWIDLSQFLIRNDENDGVNQERMLYRELIDYGMLLTPGNSMKNERPGFYRLVFTATSDDEFTIALERLETFFQHKTKATI